MPFDENVATVDGLREIYRPPSRPSVAKQIDHIDANCASFIAHAPFMVLSTADAAGRCDASPKGGPPGFVHVLDEKHLGIPDLSGNNRLDSMQNIVDNAGVALLFCIPGLDETLRVDGRATITTEPAVLDACAIADLRPRVVIGVEVDEAYIHCAKALRRAGLWDEKAWPDLTDMPSIPCMLRDHYDMPDMDLEAVERRLEHSYGQTMWLAGGDEAPRSP